jgi:hypothetical protein
LAILYRTPLDHKMSRFNKGLRTVGLGCATSVQKKSSTGIPAEDFSRKESRQFMARANQQVFPLRRLAIPLSQLERRLQRDLSQSLQARGGGRSCRE